MKKNKVMEFLAAVLMLAVLCGCAAGTPNQEADTKETTNTESKINAIATIFPEYDFLRQIGGEHLNLTMLLPPGAESHSFEPTPQDIKSINEADVFVYVGGESDAWIDSILDSVSLEDKKIVTLMDCVTPVEEEIVEGMTEEEEHDEAEGEEHGEVEYDEHVWTSPKNAELIVQKLCDALCEADPDHAEDYQKNTADYIAKLEKLDQDFHGVIDGAARQEIIVGDRFPFRYLADEYGLTYYAAFPGCASDSEPSAATIAFLIDKVKQDGIPMVFHIELSNTKVCDAICEATGAKSELLNAVHNVTKDDFENGATYISLMQHNAEVLKEALN